MAIEFDPIWPAPESLRFIATIAATVWLAVLSLWSYFGVWSTGSRRRKAIVVLRLIAVAMIGRNHPIGIIFAAIFFGGLMVGGRMMQMSAGVPLELVRIVEGVIILALAVPELKRIFHFVRAKFVRKEQRGGN